MDQNEANIHLSQSASSCNFVLPQTDVLGAFPLVFLTPLCFLPIVSSASMAISSSFTFATTSVIISSVTSMLDTSGSLKQPQLSRSATIDGIKVHLDDLHCLDRRSRRTLILIYRLCFLFVYSSPCVDNVSQATVRRALTSDGLQGSVLPSERDG